MPYKISLVDGTSPAILDAFETESLEALAEKVSTNDWTPGSFSDGHRHAESWIGSDLMVFDVDEGLSADDAIARLEKAGLQHVVLASRHHQKEKRSGKKVKPAC